MCARGAGVLVTSAARACDERTSSTKLGGRVGCSGLCGGNLAGRASGRTSVVASRDMTKNSPASTNLSGIERHVVKSTRGANVHLAVAAVGIIRAAYP